MSAEHMMKESKETTVVYRENTVENRIGSINRDTVQEALLLLLLQSQQAAWPFSLYAVNERKRHEGRGTKVLGLFFLWGLSLPGELA